MTHSLLVYENNPEGVDLYLIPNSEITAQMRDWLNEANGRMMNNDDFNNGMDFLNAALQENVDYADDFGNNKQFVSIFAKFKVEVLAGSGIENTNITNLYMSGFML